MHFPNDLTPQSPGVTDINAERHTGAVMTQQPAAGWYADPEQQGKQRWWDGNQWSEQRQQSLPPVPPPPAYQLQNAPVQYGGGLGGAPVRNRVIGIVLALLIGGLGVHKFYTDKVGLGILYLVFFWTFIPAFVAFIEGIVWAFQSDQEWASRQGVIHG
jgi:TM2 domain-containing membrane protein YozV